MRAPIAPQLTPEIWARVINCLPVDDILQSLCYVNRFFYQLIRQTGTVKTLQLRDSLKDGQLISLLRVNPSLSRITRASLSNQDQVSARAIRCLVIYCPNLRTLDLSYCKSVDEHAMGKISQLMCLRKLTLKGCENVNADALKALGEKSNLESLILDKCTQVDNSCIEALAAFPKLTELSLKSCVKISDKSLAFTSRCVPVLERIDISGCSAVTDDGVCHLGKLRLKVLSLNRCFNITDKGLEAALSSSAETIRRISIEQCYKVRGRALQRVGSSVQSLYTARCSALSSKAVLSLLCRNTVHTLSISVCKSNVDLLMDLRELLERVACLHIHLSRSLIPVQVYKLCSVLPNVTSLDVSDMAGSRLNLSLIMESCRYLESLDVSNTKPCVSKHHRDGGAYIRELSLRNALDADSFPKILCLLRRLRYLNISNNSNLRDSHMVLVLRMLPKIDRIIIADCPQITEAGTFIVRRHQKNGASDEKVCPAQSPIYQTLSLAERISLNLSP